MTFYIVSNTIGKRKNYVLSFLFLLISLPSLAQDSPVVLDDSSDSYYIASHLYHFCDTTEKLTIMEIAAPVSQVAFSRLPDPFIDHPAADKNNWIKFSVINKRSNENQSWYFESWTFNMDEIEFYVPDKQGSFFRTSMGYYKEFSQRNYYHKNFLFHIDLRPGESATYYIKVKKRYPVHLIFHIHTGEEFILHATTEYWLLGLFYGVFCFIILINIYLFIRLREKIYLFYLFCVASEVLYCLGRDGLGFQFLWPGLPWFNNFTHHNISQFLLIVSTLLYSIHFLSLHKEQKWMYRISVAAIGVKTMLFGLFYLYPLPSFYIFTIDTFILSIPFVSGIICLKKGNQFASYYVIAFSCLFLSFFLIFMNESKLIPYTVLNWYFINMGMFLEGIFLGIALIDQVRVLRNKNEEAHEKILQQYRYNEFLKDKMNMELEQKVEERTNEITALLTRLAQKNEELQASNKELEQLTNQVKEMNALLSQDNEKLKTDITQINKSRILLKDVNFEEFQKVFPDENACLKFLSELKWRNGFKCRKCDYQKFSAGKTPYGKRCKNCNYDESPTTNTLFHKLKFPITKAFYMVYLISMRDRNITLEELAETLSLRKETCWSFRQKIFEAKKNIESTDHKNEEAEGWGALALISLNN